MSTASKGERAHDATVGLAWRLYVDTTAKKPPPSWCPGDAVKAAAWREHVVATREARIARLDASSFDWPEADRPCIRCEARESCHTPECRLAGASTMDSHRWVCAEYL